MVASPTVEIIADANTVLLDHFNGSMLGTPYGPVSYEPSLPMLGDAIRVGPGVFALYSFPAWYSGCCGSTPGVEGTLEAWLRPDARGSFINFNWYPGTSPPGGGHVLYATGPTDSWGGGAAVYQTWNGERCCLDNALLGATVFPLATWTHFAVSWGPGGSKMYVNGVVDASSPDNVYPAIGGTVYVTLNDWGVPGSFSGLIDELHISKVQRSDAEIALHALRTVTVAIDIKPGSLDNAVNPKSKGVIPVAILSSADFDAVTQVDQSSLTFGQTGNEASLRSCVPAGTDVNGDGRLDLVCHFWSPAAGFALGDSEGVLKGALTSGVPLEGRDAIRIVP
jgi:hypothetical protein